jgi:catechol 2,3-dioxygenase-like lactoylglutathione lyase family enzyme
MSDYISGIQQVGIGVGNAQKAKHYYKNLFGMDVLVFEDKAEASLMTKYTGNELHRREAILTLNMQGGGGFEIWQFLTKEPCFTCAWVLFGDLGIYAVKMRCINIDAVAKHFSASPVCLSPSNKKTIWVKDDENNMFQLVEDHQSFKATNHAVGGVLGVVIGVSNIDQSLRFYKDLLGMKVIHEESGVFNDIGNDDNCKEQYRRVLLRKNFIPIGAFSKLLGDIEIELVQALGRQPATIYKNRYWGDCGFIHVCFDVNNMDGLKQKAASLGFNFTVDSADSFTMGASAGRFGYMEDPDGTLIELVETHRVPIFKKLNWYYDLKKRKHNKPLPDWMIGMMALTKVK